MLTKEYLKEKLDYNPCTGIFTWKKTWKIAGTSNKQGYVCIKINKKLYLAHRLVWLYMFGYIPHMIDHINGNTKDNKITNLRPVNNKENQQNQYKHRQGKLLGTSFHKIRNTWNSYILLNNKQVHIGVYNTEQEAHEAYLAMNWLINQIDKL